MRLERARQHEPARRERLPGGAWHDVVQDRVGDPQQDGGEPEHGTSDHGCSPWDDGGENADIQVTELSIIDAENRIERHVAAMKLDLAKLEALPKIVAEMVKPAEKIESIRIHHLSGLGSAQGSAATGKPPLNQALDSIMEMAVQLPALKKIGEDLALNLDGGFATGKDGAACCLRNASSSFTWHPYILMRLPGR